MLNAFSVWGKVCALFGENNINLSTWSMSYNEKNFMQKKCVHFHFRLQIPFANKTFHTGHLCYARWTTASRIGFCYSYSSSGMPLSKFQLGHSSELKWNCLTATKTKPWLLSTDVVCLGTNSNPKINWGCFSRDKFHWYTVTAYGVCLHLLVPPLMPCCFFSASCLP